jgi:uncharacterized protein YkwD
VQGAILCLINSDRIEAHLSALRVNQTLQSVAVGHSREMVLGNYFADSSHAGKAPAHMDIAENIGWGTGPYATPNEVLTAWMASAPHRENLLSKSYREIGVGVAPAAPATLAEGERGATYTVELAST